MEIGIKVIAENILTRTVRHANSCFFTMVAVDSEGNPTAISPLIAATSIEQRRYIEAKARKELRHA